MGGDWLPIEQCADEFKPQYSECQKSCDTCPRSRSRNQSIKEDKTYDVVIIGAGCIGGAIARELSKTNCSILLLEAADDVSQGATKGNSGIVHAGFDDVPGSLRAKFCWKGNQMFRQLDKELHFGYQVNGSLVLARGPEDEKHLQELKLRGEKNGVERLRIIDREELFQLEPHVHPECTAALLAPDAGNLIPYEYAIALIENAVDNGVELRIRREVMCISLEGGPEASVGGTKEQLFAIDIDHWEPAAYVESLQKKPVVTKKAVSPLLLTLLLAAAAGVAVSKPGVPVAGLCCIPFREQLVPYFNAFVALFFVVSAALLRDLWTGKPNASAAPVVAGDAGDAVEKAAALARLVGDVAKPVGGPAGSRLTASELRLGGSGSRGVMGGVLFEKEKVRARFVINCAGSGSDKIASMMGDNSFKIKPRLGDYILLNRNQGHLTHRTLFPCPGPLGKGVLVQTTLWGNLILGPTARDIHVPEMMNQSNEEVQAYILSKCKELVPSFDVKEAFHSFCGARAKSSTGDWVIRPSEAHPRFILAAGIDSPGLAGSPAIALEVVQLLRDAGLVAAPNPSFNPIRLPIVIPKNGWKGIKAGPAGKVIDPSENIICKCEKVTEAEVLAAVRGSLPVDSTQAVRKRTRAGMGHCQAEYENYNCEGRVAALLARELGVSAEGVGRRPWPATSTLPQRWLTDEQRQDLDDIMKGKK